MLFLKTKDVTIIWKELSHEVEFTNYNIQFVNSKFTNLKSNWLNTLNIKRYYNSALKFSFLAEVYMFNLNLTRAFLWKTQ